MHVLLRIVTSCRFVLVGADTQPGGLAAIWNDHFIDSAPVLPLELRGNVFISIAQANFASKPLEVKLACHGVRIDQL